MGRPGTGAGPGGPAAAWYFVYLGISLYILDIFGYIWIYLDIFGYMFGLFWWWWCIKFLSLLFIMQTWAKAEVCIETKHSISSMDVCHELAFSSLFFKHA